MLGRIVNGYQIIACANIDGDPEKGISVLAKDLHREVYVTGTMRLVTDIEWQNGHYFTRWDAIEASWQDFIKRATCVSARRSDQ